MSPRKASRSERIAVRDLTYNVRHWGPESAPPVFFLHGWMDTSASFQFVVDALLGEWHIIAPDWRGHGDSDWLDRPYWFPDYYADLDVLLSHFSPASPAALVGHSMGASIAASYAAVRPERVARIVMMDFLGLPPTGPEDAPVQLGKWLDALPSPPALRSYPDFDSFARRLQKANPRLTEERAAFLSQQVSRRSPDGDITMACDPWHRVPSPLRFQTEDVLAGWRRIAAPVLNLLADGGYVLERFGPGSEELSRRLACFDYGQHRIISDSGHNLHHDQPERVAREIERFLSNRDGP